MLQKIDWLYNGIRIAGALYLVWFGIKLLRASAKRGETVAVTEAAPLATGFDAHFRAWRTGLVTGAAIAPAFGEWIASETYKDRTE